MLLPIWAVCLLPGLEFFAGLEYAFRLELGEFGLCSHACLPVRKGKGKSDEKVGRLRIARHGLLPVWSKHSEKAMGWFACCPIWLSAGMDSALASDCRFGAIRRLRFGSPEAEVQVEYQGKLERCKICHKIGHRAAHCHTKSILQFTACFLLGSVSELENSAQPHSMPDSAPPVTVSNQFESLALNEVGGTELLHEVDDISGVSLKSVVQDVTLDTMAPNSLDGKIVEDISQEVMQPPPGDAGIPLTNRANWDAPNYKYQHKVDLRTTQLSA
ncbi:hypothetical protein Nepgr_028325 [Nepenthes gracilis]|uniref:Uncharacterized protein n=1 Tax=Nepenthes gracilis TaxID=150966 RepID=A0AAD3TBS0_NEPGR|nr:hypothetical protein Nepgr_028325 [Nepenthes gracilis]